ncbi:MAG: SPASM domain-containing protein [Actinomycetia bacterium]|nr:SPASM domain-containing protein [Actinomycetes bacterium]
MNRTRHLLHLAKIFFSYLKRRETPGYMPSRLWIETTSRCNLSCSLCINKDMPDSEKKDMDFGLYKKIIDEAAGSVYDANLFHRGEPLLHPQIADMVSYGTAKNIKTRLHTNATLLDGKLSRDIILAGLDMISFSFDGYTRKEYEKNREGADYEKTLENIKRFLKIKKELKAKKPLTIIQVMEHGSGKKTKERLQQRYSFLKGFESRRPDRIITRTPHNWGGLLNDSGSEPDSLTVSKKHACTFPWYSLTIFFDGRVYPCPQDFMGRISLGDLGKNSIMEIFNGREIKELRKMFKSGEIMKNLPCDNCDRIARDTFMGIPKEYINAFVRDNISA